MGSGTGKTAVFVVVATTLCVLFGAATSHLIELTLHPSDPGSDLAVALMGYLSTTMAYVVVAHRFHGWSKTRSARRPRGLEPAVGRASKV
jgi:hypothetical protein